jgi:hypothetical protein
MALLEAIEEITLFTVDMSSQASIDPAEYLQNCWGISSFDGIR